MSILNVDVLEDEVKVVVLVGGIYLTESVGNTSSVGDIQKGRQEGVTIFLVFIIFFNF